MKLLKCNICLKSITCNDIGFIKEHKSTQFILCKLCLERIEKLPSKNYYCTKCNALLQPNINCSDTIIFYFKCIDLYKVIHNKTLIIFDINYKCMNCSLQTIASTTFNKEMNDLVNSRIQQINDGNKIINSFKKTKI